jgi:hypothetical protein
MPHRSAGNPVHGRIDPLPPTATLVGANMTDDDRDLKRAHDFVDDIDSGELHPGQFHAPDLINRETPKGWPIFDVGNLAAEDGECSHAIALHHHDATS